MIQAGKIIVNIKRRRKKLRRTALLPNYYQLLCPISISIMLISISNKQTKLLGVLSVCWSNINKKIKRKKLLLPIPSYQEVKRISWKLNAMNILLGKRTSYGLYEGTLNGIVI